MIVSEIKRVKIEKGCQRSPAYITWLNTVGGREHWLFYYQQTNNITIADNGDFEPSIQDLETTRGQVQQINKKADPMLTVYGYVKAEDMNGLITLMYSLNVELLLNPSSWQTDGLKWASIRPVPGSYKIGDTTEEYTEVEFTFRLSYINTQFQ